jgi:hypothetical protein
MLPAIPAPAPASAQTADTAPTRIHVDFKIIIASSGERFPRSAAGITRAPEVVTAGVSAPNLRCG